MSVFGMRLCVFFRNRSNGTAQSNTGGTGATGTADAVEAVKKNR